MIEQRAGDDVVGDIELELLLEGLHSRYGCDFRGYSRSSLKRRLESELPQLGYATLSDLQRDVLRERGLFLRLLSVLTIPTTELFRDPPSFLALRRHVVPELRAWSAIKLWVAGCSTGEEVVSLCILLEEEGLLERTIVYATDVNPAALEQARRGICRLEDLAAPARSYEAAGGTSSLSAYYSAGYGAVLFDPRLLRRVIFTEHSLATDAVFSDMHVVCCRNVLIYFERALQDRALGLFRDALCAGGVLNLGPAETLRLSAHREAFAPLVEAQRIYRRR